MYELNILGLMYFKPYRAKNNTSEMQQGMIALSSMVYHVKFSLPNMMAIMAKSLIQMTAAYKR